MLGFLAICCETWRRNFHQFKVKKSIRIMKYNLTDGFPYYAELTENKDIRLLFQSNEYFDLYHSISEEKSNYRYMEGKWSLKQIIGHVTDHERIMMYRILRFSRKDSTILPGYDQDVFVNNSRFDELLWTDLVEDLQNVRATTLSFIKSLSADQLKLKGKAWKYELTIEEFLRATIGHELHHFNVICDKYLSCLS
jgi:uncharacterized damage-inducible protein DinB